jgi:hypothetical protein
MMPSRLNAAIGLLAIALLALGSHPVWATTLKHRNLAELISIAETIIAGTVLDVSDGLDGNLPYTEITLRISESIKGGKSGKFTFRQFGLLAPRPMPGGWTNLNVSPQGWPSFGQGEEVVVFLYRPAELTGLQTTVGLFQGKFTIENGRVANAVGNAGLFESVALDPDALTEAERELVTLRRGPADAARFMSLVRKAVRQNWFK